VRGRLTDGWATVNTHSARSKHRWDKHAYSVRREFPINLGWGFGSGTGRDRRSILLEKYREKPRRNGPHPQKTDDPGCRPDEVRLGRELLYLVIENDPTQYHLPAGTALTYPTIIQSEGM
jgi:hypothetical protein